MIDFTLIWSKYPMKDGRKNAEKAFKATVRNDKDWEDINKALDNYKAHLSMHTWKCPKNGSTFFRNWEDWVDWKEEGTYDPLADKGIFREVT